MMSPGTRTRRHLLLVAKVLVLVLLAVSPRALFAPTTSFTKATDSKRPKAPKKALRAEPLQISSLEKQHQDSGSGHPGSTAASIDRGPLRASGVRALPNHAFTQLTRPDYLNPSGSGGPPPPFAPPI